MAKERPSSVVPLQLMDERGRPSSCAYGRLYRGSDDGHQFSPGVPESKGDASAGSLKNAGRCWSEHKKDGVSSVGLVHGERRGTGSGLDYLIMLDLGAQQAQDASRID